MTDHDDLLARATARLDAQRCPGATTAGDTGLQHCAECCFGSGFEVTTQAELDDVLIIRDLAAAVRGLRDRPCPHIETSDDGTAFCTLAEAANTAWAARAERAEGVLERIRALDVSDATYADIGAAVTVILRESLAVSDRPGGTDNPTGDKPRMMQGVWPAPAEGRTVAIEDIMPDAPTGGDDDGS